MNTTNEYHERANAFLAKHDIKCRITLSNSKSANWDDGRDGERNHYRVTLSKGKQGGRLSKRFTFDFWGSIADAKANRHPVAYDVLACISSDANTPETFADFCNEYGYDSDSIKARDTFKRCSVFARRLRAFFTSEELESLSEIN